jgi:hypothetical protein
MSKTLAEQIAVAPARAHVVAECVALVDGEVQTKSGLSGIAIKGAFAAVTKIKPGFIASVVDALLDEWVAKMEPYYARWRSGGQGSLGEFFAARSDDVAEDLLAVTDAKLGTTRYRAAASLYEKMRASAKKHVAVAVPKLGALVERHVAA